MTDVHTSQSPSSCFLKPTNECKAERATPLPQPLEEAPLLRFGSQWPPCLVWLLVLQQFALLWLSEALSELLHGHVFPLTIDFYSLRLPSRLPLIWPHSRWRPEAAAAARLPRRGDVSALRVGRWREKGKFGPCLGFGWRAGRRGRAG